MAGMALVSALVVLWALQPAAFAAEPWSWKAEAVPPGQGAELVLPAGASQIEIWSDPVAPLAVAANGVVLAPTCVVGGHWYGQVEASTLVVSHDGAGPVTLLAGPAVGCGEQASEEPSQQPSEEPVRERPTEEPTKEPVGERPTEEPTKEPVRERPTQEPVPVRPSEEPVRGQPTHPKPTEEPVRERATTAAGPRGAAPTEREEARQVATASSGGREARSPSVPGRNARSAFRGTAPPLRFSSQTRLADGGPGVLSALAPQVAGPAAALPVAAGPAPAGTVDSLLTDPPPPPATAGSAVLVVADAGPAPFAPRLPFELFGAAALGFVALRRGTRRRSRTASHLS